MREREKERLGDWETGRDIKRVKKELFNANDPQWYIRKMNRVRKQVNEKKKQIEFLTRKENENLQESWKYTEKNIYIK